MRHLDEKLKEQPDNEDLLVERKFVDEICESHSKPGEEADDTNHDMALTGDQEKMIP